MYIFFPCLYLSYMLTFHKVLLYLFAFSIKHYSHKLQIADLDEGLMGDITEMERHLLDTHDLIQTRGKVNAIFVSISTQNDPHFQNMNNTSHSNHISISPPL